MRRCLAIALAALLGPTTASADCDPTCAVIKSLLGDRANDFASVKSTLYAGETDHWRATVAPLRMECSVELKSRPEDHSVLGCLTPFDKTFTAARARQRLAELLAGFRSAEPGWSWFKVKDQPADELDLYGGPSQGNYTAYVSVTFVGVLGHIEFEIRSKDLDTKDPLAPYRP